jgi:hypothetical protein
VKKMEQDAKIKTVFNGKEFIAFVEVIEGGNARRVVLKRGEISKLKTFSFVDETGVGRLFYE